MKLRFIHRCGGQNPTGGRRPRRSRARRVGGVAAQLRKHGCEFQV